MPPLQVQVPLLVGCTMVPLALMWVSFLPYSFDAQLVHVPTMLRQPDGSDAEVEACRLRSSLRFSLRLSLRLFSGPDASGAASPDTDFSCLPMLPPVLPAWAAAAVAPANETAVATSAHAIQ